MEKERRTPYNGFPAAHTTAAPRLPAPLVQGGKRGPGQGGPELRGQTRPQGCPAWPHQHPLPSRPGAPGSKHRTGCGLDIAVSCKHGLAAGHPPPRRGNPSETGKEPGALGELPRAAAGSGRAAGRPSPGGLRSQLGYCERSRARLVGCK